MGLAVACCGLPCCRLEGSAALEPFGFRHCRNICHGGCCNPAPQHHHVYSVEACQCHVERHAVLDCRRGAPEWAPSSCFEAVAPDGLISPSRYGLAQGAFLWLPPDIKTVGAKVDLQIQRANT